MKQAYHQHTKLNGLPRDTHYNELYAGVADKDTIQVLLALSAHFDYELDQVDIKAAFLNRELEEKIYLEPPEGSDIPAGSILRLCKSLYGLKQSP